MMFYLDPHDLITDALVERIHDALGSDLRLERAALVDTLALIFSRLDTFPVFDRELDSSELTALAEGLLTDGIVRLLTMSGYTHDGTGFLLGQATTGSLDLQVLSRSLLPINLASADEVDMLPGMGRALSSSIINERRSNGPFVSVQDLVDRIDGMGPQAGADLAHVLSFAFPEASRRSFPRQHDLGEAISLLVSLTPGVNVVSRLATALDQVATALAAEAPIGVPEIPHALKSYVDSNQFRSAAIEVLEGSTYFRRVPELIDGAALSIDVCMFHIALPSGNHPTRTLLDGLLNSHDRNVTVRVLLDRDRPGDPYRSTLINSPARDLLNRDAELCRFDDESVLLHSKYMVLDAQVVVIGSHNWSAGSFFGFDDLSVVVHSPDYAAYMTTRFAAQWTDAANSQ